MKKYLAILLILILMLALVGCEYAENWTKDVLLSTEEPLPDAITRVTAEPTEVPTETPFVPATPAPDATAIPAISDPIVTVEDGATTVKSKAMGFSMTVYNPEWTADPAWDVAHNLPSAFVFFHKMPETGGNLIGAIVYSYDEGEMEDNLNQKIEAVMTGVADYRQESIQLGEVNAVYTLQEMDDGLSDYLGINVFWIDGDRVVRITASAEVACEDEVWALIGDMAKSYERYEG